MKNERWKILQGDVAYEVRKLAGMSFDAVLSDPPYGISFMGVAVCPWDKQVPSASTWASILQVLKPGAPLIAFGGSRKFHRLGVAIEDGGFELIDCLSWNYVQGFPKSTDASKQIDGETSGPADWLNPKSKQRKEALARRKTVATKTVTKRPGEPRLGKAAEVATHLVSEPHLELAKAFDGFGTALKPGWEPAFLFRRALEGTILQNIKKHGTGVLDIDASRIGTGKPVPMFDPSKPTKKNHVYGDLSVKRGDTTGFNPDLGYWPSNVLFDEGALAIAEEATQRSGGLARFFFCAKPSRGERDYGLDGFDVVPGHAIAGRKKGSAGSKNGRAGTTGPRKNVHPTVKPIKLMEYLARMLLPPPREDGNPRRLLVPFSGSGSEMIGALLAGWDEVVGIEREPKYVEIANARIAAWMTKRRP